MRNTYESARPLTFAPEGFDAAPRVTHGYHRVVVSLPEKAAPTATAIFGLGLSLVAAGSLGNYPTGYEPVQLTEFSVPVTVQKPLDRRRRFATAAQALSDIRLWSGLAWASIADILQVTRRAVHNWASGEEPSGARATALNELHQKAEEFSRHGQATASALLASHYRVEARIKRVPRQLVNPGAILSADNTPLKNPPTSAGVRMMKRVQKA